MKHKLLMPLFWSLAAVSAANPTTSAPVVTEMDFLSDMPIVLSVSRLAQRLDETPGAVTILDRQFIRLSGARDVADLLRLVPGFQTTTSFETDAPMATYHGRTDDWANRIQVLVDGRSVYAGHLQGSAGLGWQTLALDDIERIEILRGSNSAAYGARAFLGVVNIVSRDVRETLGAGVSVALGENKVRDAGFRWGWGDIDATYRISADVRGDDGLRNAFGRNRVIRFNAASHFNLNRETELAVRGGALGVHAGRGTPGDVGNNGRERFMGSQFVQLDWHTTLDGHRDFSISASHTEHTFRDDFQLNTTVYDTLSGATYNGTRINFSGHEKNDAVSAQYTVRSSPTLRYVIGAELRREELSSPASFDVERGIATNFLRFFGNAEWRVAPNLILNAGAMAERISDGGDTLSPRFMLNWQLADGQTLRAGVSTAIRPPSAYEKYTDVKYYDRNGQNPLVWRVNDGQLEPERVLVREIGYFAKLPTLSLTADVRVFHEGISKGIANNRPAPPADPEIYKNSEASSNRGLEYQINFQPIAGTRIFWSQTWTHIEATASIDPVRLSRTEGGAAPRAASLAVFHSPAPGWEMSLGYHMADGISLMSADVGQRYALQRTDMRLAHAFRIGANKSEVALTVQNLGPATRDGDRKFYFDQRTVLTLRVEY